MSYHVCPKCQGRGWLCARCGKLRGQRDGWCGGSIHGRAAGCRGTPKQVVPCSPPVHFADYEDCDGCGEVQDKRGRPLYEAVPGWFYMHPLVNSGTAGRLMFCPKCAPRMEIMIDAGLEACGSALVPSFAAKFLSREHAVREKVRGEVLAALDPFAGAMGGTLFRKLRARLEQLLSPGA